MRHRHSHGHGPGPTQRGLSDRLNNPPGLLLFNFDIGSAHLKMEHHQELKDKIVPRIRFRHGITVVGLASRTGSDALNMRLSHLRAENTLTALDHQWRDFKRMPAVAFGERKAKAEGSADNTEDPRFRAVAIYVGPREDPPFAPGVIDVSPSVPESLLPEDGGPSMGQVSDSLNMLGQFLEQVPWEKVAAFGENLDLATTIFIGVAGMPMLWSEVKEQNEQNGKLMGYWECLQDLARQYSRPGLSKTPLENWPDLRRVQPRPIANFSGSATDRREWMDGKRQACDALFEGMGYMDRKPELVNSWELTGRRWLFQLYQKFGEGTEAAAKREMLERLSRKHMSFPINK